ncbi:P-II family nitrogen regulator [candidate division KSB1 bacterium]|nr:P-II family nitrogen regulator [candidate division KSB1 bacterium]NIR69038.1 P-II family nitrogen regulator [candidate division KSB1 bacterium]NIS25606.1 P-II family nitrogen regulator [candidate division KSB1 bacterium]NIT73956.1 P-II family nitrogen regulator [candidate division KSB1 bacterium]NIU26283.1 P-II family nitrogen regulator [candidate division KSB1 bacterium]
MKEVKAYVRIRMVDQVVRALEEAGFDRMTIIDVSALGKLADEKEAKYSIEFVEKHSKMAKIELACKDRDVDQVVETIQKNACTHQPGDGIIFVAPVERAVKIRTCEEGEQILQA